LAVRRVHRGERGAVPETPDQPFQRRRHQLAVLAEDRAVRAEIDRGAIQRAAVALDDAGHHVHLVARGGLGELCDFGTVDRHGRVEITLELGAALRRASAQVDVEVRALRIAADEGFGKHQELYAAPGRLRHQGERALYGRGCVQQDGGSLRDGSGEFRLSHEISLSWPSPRGEGRGWGELYTPQRGMSWSPKETETFFGSQNTS